MSLDLSLSTLGSIDSYDRYMQSIRTIPSLTAEEEMALGMRLKKSNDLEAAKTLILSHLKLVAKVAKGYSGYGLPQSDLVQEGNIGLMKAVKRFDPERGVRLVSFAIYWIKAEIQEYIVKNWRLVKTATTKAQRKLFFNLRSMKKTLQPLKSDEINSIAKELNVKPEDVREMEYRFNGNEISLDYGSEESEDDVYRPIAYLKDEAPEPSEQMEIDQSESNSLSTLKTALLSLDERSRLILEERWLKDKDASTLHELADKLGVSAERIRQIEQSAMKKIKSLLQSSIH
ncbi:RNA polymerase sigma factor RpoH [Candidatus Methylopumilus universalis]|uniref:RNA polymerase sigma factor n=1 Tax=Candidatus Methylopumilus universalis TaxID=2588536 RepID=A0AAX1EZW9_9PROT|nr:RNA polymerase sigma factor RpoH [Candidatus Methylopumilus universalis]QDC41383.1 RNA polymerase sigma factor RpoH [Candidatus Methylopumilus universalis]QDC42666.1 RNA polymerase sigma factor RpoH [Candidatus Methylopumilus universalis]QDC47670.1 RNA polymerase sigma factor RpoH [Candidatus Methylopumilus universalis]QDC55052.1 RNA polymerase sigma factor RpoH [Candidatus Methylopumilus universalis]QDC56333.1 RNA polymerase sigma factor RpoH [Candidatus Methylopumilus universalis]